ncbi:hypothetical protein P9112_006986 [Eukaryota sp. TZLM1-RC]
MSGVVLQDLIRRLRVIQTECGVEDPSNNAAASSKKTEQSTFRLTRRQISEDLKNIRMSITERDELSQRDPNDIRIPQLSAKIRKDIDEVETQLNNLEKLKTAKVKKNVQDDTDETKETSIALIRELVTECRNLEANRVSSRGKSLLESPTRPRSKSKSKPNKVSLFRDSLLGNSESKPQPKEMTTLSSALEDIDVDTGIQKLDQIEKEQDQELEEMVKDVRKVKEIVVGIGHELDVQGHMIDRIEEDMEDNAQQLDRVSTKMRRSLVAARGGSKFTVDIILLIILVGILSYVYNLVSS